MNRTELNDKATFLLRLALGVMYLAHGAILKFHIFGLANTAQFFETLGLPGWSAYLVFSLEAVGGTLLVLGIQSRWVTLALLPILLGATWAHSGNGWVFSNANGGWEYPLYLILLSVAQFLPGDGACAIMKSAPIPFVTHHSGQPRSI